LDPAVFKPHGLPSEIDTPDKLRTKPKLLRMYLASMGGMKGDTVISIDQRVAAVEKIRVSASGGTLPPGTAYAQVGDNPLEKPLADLLNGTGQYVGDLMVPPPVRAFVEGAPVEADVADDELSTAACGEFWAVKVKERASAADALDELFVIWTARLLAGMLGASSEDASAIDEAFGHVMSFGVQQAHRTILSICLRYAPADAAQHDLRATGYRTSNYSSGIPLLVASSGTPLHPNEAALPPYSPILVHHVELMGGSFDAYDCGSLCCGSHTGTRSNAGTRRLRSCVLSAAATARAAMLGAMFLNPPASVPICGPGVDDACDNESKAPSTMGSLCPPPPHLARVQQ
jgi:hypothetical protein